MTKYSALFPFCLSITSLLDVFFLASFSPGPYTYFVIFDNEVSEHAVRIAYVYNNFVVIHSNFYSLDYCSSL